MIKRIAKLIIIGMVLIGAYVFFQVNVPKVNYVNVNSSKIPKEGEFKILQISDMHNKKFFDGNRKLFNMIEDLDFDIIVITGDLIDGETRDFNYIYSVIEKLKNINSNIYYVSGNHEWRTGRHDEFVKGLLDRKVIVLNNDNSVVSKDDYTINICGINDPYTNHENVKEAFNDIDDQFFTLLLSHSPGIIERQSNIPADLILSGHTHGGQIRLPIIGALVAPGQGFFPKYDKGKFELDNGTILYIDSGLGTSQLPIRFLDRSQISLISIGNE